MSCTHGWTEDERGLPCPWPGCPEGTPQDQVAVLSGQEGVMRIHKPYRMEVEADEGVALYRRRRVGDGWTWESVGEE